MKYTVNVYGTIEKQYTLVADSIDEAEEVAMDYFEETETAVSGWSRLDAEASIREEE